MKQPFWKVKHDFLCLKIIGMLDKDSPKSQIISVIQQLRLENFPEVRYNDGSHYTKDEHGRFTGSTSTGSSSSGSVNRISGAISGALDPYSQAAEDHAKRYYELVRHMTGDTQKIAENTHIGKDKIDKIKNHVFIKEHDLWDGQKRRFDPSYHMAQSWQRLMNGKNIKEQDWILLKHEYCELRYMEKGLTQDQAHIKASKRYNYAKYCD